MQYYKLECRVVQKLYGCNTETVLAQGLKRMIGINLKRIAPFTVFFFLPSVPYSVYVVKEWDGVVSYRALLKNYFHLCRY